MAEGGGGGNKDELEPDEGQDDLAWFEEEEDEQEEEEENEEDEQLLLSICRCQDAGAGRGSSASTCTSTAAYLGQDTTSALGVAATERRGHRDHGGSGGALPWRFSFSTAACAMCDGYYGPNFGQHVCTTCHLFLYPDDINLPVEANNFSQVQHLQQCISSSFYYSEIHYFLFFFYFFSFSKRRTTTIRVTTNLPTFHPFSI